MSKWNLCYRQRPTPRREPFRVAAARTDHPEVGRKLLSICQETIVPDFKSVFELFGSRLFGRLVARSVSNRLAVWPPPVLLHTGSHSRQLLCIAAHHRHNKYLLLIVSIMCQEGETVGRR